MERGREGRRGGGGGGLVHAPRRPRTGFKDAAVGDDAEDMMDDVHNSRLRERTKKDGSGVSVGHGVATSIVGPSSRNKRKRQGSQEIQVHARNSPADEVEETTEDTEMGVSEDDDDPPPPIIPRRPGKPRPQSKFAEDGIAVDLPAVPRKARTAMGKRPQESASASVAESPAHGAGAVAASTPAPSSTPSSSSIASLKPGRRTKPSGSKPRGHKLAKVSTPSLVSEQEVEVAEALFDLARMCTQPPPSASAVEAKKESRSSVNDVKSEAKQEPKVVGSSLPPHAPNGHSAVPSGTSAGVASVAGGSVRSNSPGVASAASPAPSPPAAAAASVADGSKKKRPKTVRTRTEEGVVVQSRMAPSPASGAGSVVTPVKDADLLTSRPSPAERSGVKVEGSVSVPIGAVAVAPNVSVPALIASGAGVASSGMVGLASAVPGVSVGVSVGRVEKLVVDKKGVPSEKKIGSVVGKPELSISNSVEKRVSGSPVREKKSVSGEAAVAPAPAEGPSAPSPSLGVGAVAPKMEADKRSPEAAACPSDVDHVSKRDIDLMVAPSKAVGLSSVEKDGYVVEGDVGSASENRLVDASSVSVSEDRLRAERDREREEKERSEVERGREKERERELERERVERDRRREAESARELAKESVKEREREKERERAELSKAGVSVQRSGKSGKAENGRAPKASERAGSGPASGASPMLGSVAPGVGSVGAGVGGNVAVLPMSVGMLSWPSGMSGGLGYFPGAAAASSAAVEDSSPAAQVPPYMMGGRASWKRCAMHVYIARFIDMQQQVNRHHQSFFAGGPQAYPKSYNLNVPLAPSESLFGGAGGGGSVGIVGGAAASGSTGGSGSASANLEATERGLNAAVMAAAAAASMQGVKERAAYSMDMVSRKSPGQHQGSGQGAPSLSLQSGAMFGFPPAGSGSPSGGVVVGVSGGGGGAMGGTNLNLPPGPGPGVALSSGSSSALVLGAGGPVGGLSSVGSSGAAASASAALQQAQQAMMHQAMLHQAQSGSFPFAQFPSPFGPATFGGAAPHMGAQQAAAQFYAGAPYFTQHLVSPSQLQGVPPSGSAGGGPVSKLQQQQQQQQGVSRSFGGGVSVPPQSPSHSALQGASHAVGRSGEREGSAVGENGSSGEGKFPMPRGSALGVGGSGGMSLHSVGSGASEYNLMSGLGKQSKSREPGPSMVSQGVSPVQLQGQGPHQHHYHGGAGAHLGKGPEGAPSQGFSVNMNMAAAMNSRGASVGPGPLGLAPVAAVMAPQGHAMIQSMSESGRVHPQGGGSGHAHAQMGGGAGHSSMMQQGRQQLMQLQHAQQQQHFQAQAQAQQSQQQQQHLQQQSVQGQQLQQQQQQQLLRGAPNARSSAGVDVEDSRVGADGSYSSGVGRVREREVVEDRKLQGKRSSGGASPLSRDVEGGVGMQSSPGGVGGVARSVGTTLNLMTPINAGIRSGGPSGASLSVGSPMQAQVQAGAMSGSKSAGVRPKGGGGPGLGPSGVSVSGGPHMVGTQGSFSERVPGVSGGAAGVGGKASPPRVLSVGGPNMVPGPVGRSGPVGQHAGAKASPSPSGRAALVSGATATPTAPGTNLQAVLAAAMAKNPQGQQTQRSSGNASANANSNANANAGSSARPGAGPAGPPASSGAAPLSSSAPPAKSSGSNPAKSSSSGKSSFPASGKGGAGGGGGGGKRASSPSSGGHAPSILGPSPLAQNMPSKSSQQAQVQMQGSGQWEGQLAPPHLLQHQFHQHQQMMRQQQQQQMMQQQMFQQHHQQQQHQLQQSPHMQGSPSGPPHLQAPKQASHQQQGGHQPPPPPSPSAQAQQVSINQQNQQQSSHAHQQQQASQPQQQFVGPSGNGSLSFSSGLSMGAGNSVGGGGVGVGRSSYSESAGGALNVRPLQSVKPSGSGSNPALNGVGQRGGGAGAGPVFLQQFGSSVAVSSGQQQSGSPRGGNASGYSQSQGNAISGAGGRSGDGKSFSDGGQEQVNGVRMAPGSAQARGVAPMAASPGAPGSSQRAPSGGSGHGPGPGGVAGPPKGGGGGGVQYNGFGDVGQLRPGMMSNSGSVSGSVGGMSGSGTNVQSVGNGRPGFSGGSLHMGGPGQGQIQAASSLAMTGPAVVPSGPAAVLGPQPTTSVVQQ